MVNELVELGQAYGAMWPAPTVVSGVEHLQPQLLQAVCAWRYLFTHCSSSAEAILRGFHCSFTLPCLVHFLSASALEGCSIVDGHS